MLVFESLWRGYFFGVADDGTIFGVDKEKSKKIKADLVSAMNNPQKISPTVYLPVDEIEIEVRLYCTFMFQKVRRFTIRTSEFSIETKTEILILRIIPI